MGVAVGGVVDKAVGGNAPPDGITNTVPVRMRVASAGERSLAASSSSTVTEKRLAIPEGVSPLCTV